MKKSTGQHEVLGAQQADKIRPRTDEQEMTSYLFFFQPHKVFIYSILLVVMVNLSFEFDAERLLMKPVFRNYPYSIVKKYKFSCQVLQMTIWL